MSGLSAGCAVLGVSRSGFHAWLKRPISVRAALDAKLVRAIVKSFRASDRTYGARCVWRDVLEDGLACGLHRIELLMRRNAMRARPRRRGKPKDGGERSVIADNMLDHDFEADRLNQKWLADFTHVWTAEGWLSVAVVLDLFYRRIVGPPGLAGARNSPPGCFIRASPDRLARVNEGGSGRLLAGHGRADDGGLETRQGRYAASPFRPGLAVRQRAISAPRIAASPAR